MGEGGRVVAELQSPPKPTLSTYAGIVPRVVSRETTYIDILPNCRVSQSSMLQYQTVQVHAGMLVSSTSPQHPCEAILTILSPFLVITNDGAPTSFSMKPLAKHARLWRKAICRVTSSKLLRPFSAHHLTTVETVQEITASLNQIDPTP